MGYIGLQLMPIFAVSEQAANYPVIPQEALFNLLDTKRGPLGHYNRSEDEFEDGFYSTSENGLERRIDKRYAAIYGTRFAYELTISNILMNDILRAQEYRVASKLFSETNFKTAIAASTAWSTVATALPKNDVDTGKEVLRALGVIPDTLAMGYTTFLYLTQNAKIQERVYQLFPDTAKDGNIGIEHLKTYFQVPNILVGGALYNASKRGQDASLSDMWGSTYALLCKTATGDITEPCIGRTFKWNEGASSDVIVEQYYSDEVRSDILRVRHDTAEAFLASFDSDGSGKSTISKNCGYLIDVTGN